jgi:hypothetical protein
MPHHQVAHDTTGNLAAENVVLFDGGKLPERTDVDAFNFWSTAQLSNKALQDSCERMDIMGLCEKDYLWVSVDAPYRSVFEYMQDGKRLYAIGDRAHEFLKQNNQTERTL